MFNSLFKSINKLTLSINLMSFIIFIGFLYSLYFIVDNIKETQLIIKHELNLNNNKIVYVVNDEEELQFIYPGNSSEYNLITINDRIIKYSYNILLIYDLNNNLLYSFNCGQKIPDNLIDLCLGI